MSFNVGIGVSAGGLKALEALTSLLPKTSGNVYFIIQHLDATKQSSLDKLLSKDSTLPVHFADEHCKFSPNTIYIISPKHNLVYKNRDLHIEVNREKNLYTPSINSCFEELALYAKTKSAGVILTGSGSDGTLGLEKIKEQGGVTIVQSPVEAQYPSMPQSAIDTVEPDYILPIHAIAQYFKNPLSVEKDAPPALKKIMTLLQAEEKINLQKYKRESVIRRIHKRMILSQSKNFEAYLSFLKANTQELHLLFQDFLIGVTSFFRDKEAFKTLETQLYNYLKNKPEGYELRVWSVACSSGEEAYSLAILVTEIAHKLDTSFKFQLFATDINDEALSYARRAWYSKESLSQLDQSLRDKYFIAVDDGYRVVHSLRQQIVFTHHNILSDPPLINQDIISCRNLLIYIAADTQKELLRLFHYSLKHDGIIFLGSSESTLSNAEYFTALSSEHKVYKKEEVSNPLKLSSHYFSQHLKSKNSGEVVQRDHKSIEEMLQESIFDFFAPNCIVINKNHEIIYKKGELPFLHISDGFVTLNLLKNIDERLRYDIRSLVKKTLQTSTKNSTPFIELPSSHIFIRATAHPFGEDHSNSMLLLHFEILRAEELQFNTEQLLAPNESSLIHSLSSQLNTAKEELHSLSDELIVYKENAQALSEELQSTNEELQSSNEELETSNEELQSSNEELHTAVVETQKLKDEFALILNSSHDAIFGLDINGNHTFVNNAALALLGFSLDELLGQNGHKFWHHSKKDGTPYPIEECHVHYALHRGVSRREEDLFYKKDGTPIEVEVLQNPIIQEHRVVGAVLSFHDITERNRLKRVLEHEHELANLYLNVSGNIVLKLNKNGEIEMINSAGAQLLGLPTRKLIGMNWFDNFIPEEISQELNTRFSDTMSHNAKFVSTYKNVIVDVKKQEHLISWRNHKVYDSDGNLSGVIASGTDISNEKDLTRKLFEQEHLYKLTFEEADVGIAHTSLDGHLIDTNEYLTKLLGYSKEEFKEMSVEKITHQEDALSEKKLISELLDNQRKSYHLEKRFIHKSGKIIWGSINVVLLKDEFNKPLYLLKILKDITEVKLLMYQLEMEKNELNRIIKFTPIPIMIHKDDGEIVSINQAFERSSGYRVDEIPTIDILMSKFYQDVEEQTRAKLKNDYKDCNFTREIEHTILIKTGKKHIWILKSATLHTETDQEGSFITAALDITDIKNKDDIMIAQSRQAAMGEMLAMIAHQWRQPLSVIAMNANIIKAELELDEEIKKSDLNDFVDSIAQQTQHLSTTIDDFRDFFKPDRKKESISIASIFEKIVTFVAKSLENNNIKLELPSKQDITLFTFPNQLIQVLLNLINNAKDAIKEKNPENGIIKITLEETQSEIIIGVVDNGGGIDPSIKKTISQPYVSTKSKNGTGLGLYMSKTIAQKHLDARLYWDSDERGSSFYIALQKSEEA